MKGNEARVVFFLQPVDQVKDGKVAEVEPFKKSVGIISLLLLALVLGLVALTYLFLTPYVGASQPEAVSTRETSSESTTSEPVSATPRSIEVTRERPRENKSNTESRTFLPGKIVVLESGANYDLQEPQHWKALQPLLGNFTHWLHPQASFLFTSPSSS